MGIVMEAALHTGSFVFISKEVEHAHANYIAPNINILLFIVICYNIKAYHFCIFRYKLIAAQWWEMLLNRSQCHTIVIWFHMKTKYVYRFQYTCFKV